MKNWMNIRSRTHPNNRIPDYVMCNNPRQGGGSAILYRGDAVFAALRLARDVFAAHGLIGDRSAYPAYGDKSFPRQVWPAYYGLRRVPVGDGSWADAVYEVPLTARGWGEGQPPGNDRVLLDASLNYLAVTTDRGEYEVNVRQ
ncbi:hypothetical protein UCREL1_4941 [Eutypa lata UCREL1]|uniref:Uncharacterized protein n=1 Tax=Eutypa lata (strain UCR-EL1) TaxID=1287681 RepID=M7TDS4_EUTLA|nr:hypothetical protein UCREL1_4941 [Eutypa lata UCREL1]